MINLFVNSKMLKPESLNILLRTQLCNRQIGINLN